MKITNVKKQLGDFLLNINEMCIPMGKINGIIGANGCGKTTTMKILAGLIKPDNGYVDYNGLTPRDITMVFRKPYLLHDTVIRNLTYPLNVRKMKLPQDELNFYLEISGLKEAQNQYAPGLSGGQQQKLALIRAMIFKPKVILIDEAFSNLDIKSAGTFEKLILEQQKEEKTTYIICSHQLSHIKRMCSHVFFMENGQVEVEGNEILTNPQNPYLIKYLQYLK